MSLNSPSRRDGGQRLGPESGLDALRESSEFRGPIEPLDGHETNDHFALIYETQREQFDAAVPFVEQGLERGEQVLYIADENSEEAVVEAMRERGVDVDAALATGALTVSTKRDTYLRDGAFDPDAVAAYFADAIDEATEAYEGLRVAGEMTWVFGNDPEMANLVEYEAKVNELLPDEDCIALCQYNRERFPAEVIRDVVRTHPHLIYDSTVCQNFYYTPPEEFFGPERPDRELDRMLRMQSERTRAKASLRERTATLREKHEIISRTDLSFEEKLRRFLELGRKRFGLDIGYLAHAANGEFEIVDAIGDHESIQPGGSVPPGSYCNRVVETGGLVCIEDAREADVVDSEASELFELESYLGTAVTVGGETYGTLCFASREPREEPFSESERTFLELTERWVSYELEREQRQAKLAALTEMSRDLMDAESDDEIAEATVDHAEGTLALSLTAFVRYDTDAGQFETLAQTDRATDELPTASLSEIPSGTLWDAFTAGERRVVGDVESIHGSGDGITELAAIPLGSHGVFVTGTEAAGGFCDAELDFVRTAAATVESACGRTHRERLLQEREQTLAEQNESLTRLNRINDTIRSIGQALVQASSREEIEGVVCDQLADIDLYELAWVGEYDSVTDEITPREWAGAEKGYLDAATVTAGDDATGCGPAGTAVKTDERQVVNNVLDDPDFEPWREEALKRGYHATIALPLVYEDILYGVLNVYANQPGTFDDLEQSVLAELGDTIAHAINAVERKKALVSDEVTQLEFVVSDSELEIVSLARETGCELLMEGVVPGTDGALRVYMSSRGISGSELLSFAPDLATTDLSIVSEYEGEEGPVCLFEATLSEDSLCETVRQHGGRPRSIAVEDGTATVVVEVAADAEIREFVAMFTRNYPDSELVAQRTSERPHRTPIELRASLTDELTSRQLEVLQTAYFGGYFERPRDQTGSEVAESLDISQPTFNTHVRAAQRKLCRELFEAGRQND